MFSFYYFLTFCFSVDRSKYNDCNSTPFCRRNRFVTSQDWLALPDLSFINNNTYSLPVLSKKTKMRVLFNANFLLNNCFHIKISSFSFEIGPKRFDCSNENSIVNRSISKNHKIINEERNSTHIILTSEEINSKTNKIIIQIKPFIVFIYEGETLKLSINSDNFMIFEIAPSETSEAEDYEINDIKKSIAASFVFYDKRVKFSGLPSHTLPLNLSDTTEREPIRFYNTDINRFEVNSGMSMYGSIPYVVGHSGHNSTSVFWCNPSETYVDIYKDEQKVRFISETDFIDAFIFVGSHSSVIEEFSLLTGRSPMHQYFTFGYHQCRWTYYSSNEIRSVSANLDEKLIPHDVMWLDLDHSDEKMYFTFNNNYKDILELTNEMVEKKRRLVAQVDPHLKAIQSYPVYKEANDRNFLITNEKNEPFYGNCWPGRSAWVDFYNPNARQWWAKRFNYSLYKGSSKYLFIWNDMNEPAVFDVKDFTLPKNALHFRGYEDRSLHNLYGHYMVMSTYNGVVKRNENENERAFVLTRSYFAGSQKYALMWTGDNTASWEMLANSLIMTLHLGISAFPISGSDVGGFFDSPNDDLLSRWYQLGAFAYPFYRCHCHHLSARREPYLLKGDYFKRVKTAICERYCLLPYWYTLMRESFENGHPIVRPVWYEFDDENAEDIEDQIMIGDSILVAPVVTESQSSNNERNVILPGDGRWYDFWTLQEINAKNMPNSQLRSLIVKADLNVPAFIKGGKSFCKKEIIRKSSEYTFQDPFSLFVCLDNEQKSSGKLYIDDGHSFNYTHGEFIGRLFEFKDNCLSCKNSYALSKEQMENNEFYQQYNVDIMKIKIAGMDKIPTKIVNEKNGQNIDFSSQNGVIVIDEIHIPVKEDWSLKFIFE